MKSRYAHQDPTPRSWDAFDQLFDTGLRKNISRGEGRSSHRSFHREPSGELDRRGAEAPELDNIPDYCSDISTTTGPPTPPDYEYIDQIWAEVRKFKQRELAKEKSKIKSLESPPELAYEPVHIPMQQRPVPTPMRRPTVKFRLSSTRETMAAIFDMTGVAKKDVHIGFHPHQLVITWSIKRGNSTSGHGNDGDERIVKYSKTLALPPGTKFEQIHAGMDGHYLMLRYPYKDEIERNETVDSS